jgi:cell division septal protein FtsQ
MVRDSALSAPLRPRKRKKARRRFDVSLNMPGAEMRLPAIPQVHISWRVISGLIVVALSFLVYHLWNSPTYHVGAARITGLRRLSPRDVNTVLDISGQPVFTIDPEALKKRLETTFPEFAGVEVQVGLPNSVTISVDERQPILAWHQDNRTLLVDSEGFAFPIRGKDDALPPIVVEAINAPTTGQQEVLENGEMQFMPVEMVSALVSMNAMKPRDTPLVFSQDHGLGWRDSGGWEVYFGDVRSMDVKLRVYKAIVEHLRDEGLRAVLISVEHVHNPYYRLAQ